MEKCAEPCGPPSLETCKRWRVHWEETCKKSSGKQLFSKFRGGPQTSLRCWTFHLLIVLVWALLKLAFLEQLNVEHYPFLGETC